MKDRASLLTLLIAMPSKQQTPQGLCVVSCGECETSGMCARKREKLGYSILPTKGWLTAKIKQVSFNLDSVREAAEGLENDLVKYQTDLNTGKYR